MPRKGEVPKRKPLPDPKFTDQSVDTRRRVTKFVNTVMSSGKKAIAERIVYRAFDIIAEKAKDDPVKVWDRALGNVQPKVEVKSRRVGGATLSSLARRYRRPNYRAASGFPRRNPPAPGRLLSYSSRLRSQ